MLLNVLSPFSAHSTPHTQTHSNQTTPGKNRPEPARANRTFHWLCTISLGLRETRALQVAPSRPACGQSPPDSNVALHQPANYQTWKAAASRNCVHSRGREGYSGTPAPA